MWLTRTEAAEHCRICERSFRSRVKDGRLPAPKRLGRRLLWLDKDLDAAIAGENDAPSDPIMAAIHAAESKAAAKRGAQPR